MGRASPLDISTRATRHHGWIVPWASIFMSGQAVVQADRVLLTCISQTTVSGRCWNPSHVSRHSTSNHHNMPTVLEDRGISCSSTPFVLNSMLVTPYSTNCDGTTRVPTPLQRPQRLTSATRSFRGLRPTKIGTEASVNGKGFEVHASAGITFPLNFRILVPQSACWLL